MAGCIHIAPIYSILYKKPVQRALQNPLQNRGAPRKPLQIQQFFLESSFLLVNSNPMAHLEVFVSTMEKNMAYKKYSISTSLKRRKQVKLITSKQK